MKISLNWIKEYTDIPAGLAPEEIAAQLTLSTCEVEGVEMYMEHLSKIQIVEITSIAPHPNAEKLKLVSFTTGNSQKSVVCGAPNVESGLKVPFAPLGTTLPGGFTLEAKDIRGVVSEGMLCAEDELGLGDSHEGLMVLPSDAVVGTSLAELLSIDADIILDIDNKSITHRPDLWGHYGIAREFSAIYSNPLKRPFGSEWAAGLKAMFSSDPAPVTIEVEPSSACLGYIGLSVDNIRIQSSPAWMQQRLQAAGLRPINNIVDISNYVMLEMGMPNHIFDRDTIRGGKIVVKEMQEPINFTTLDEFEREILPGDTMVCDAEGPSVIGGIMGGLDSSVKEDTHSIFIEVANWVDARIRRTSTRLGLRTDSSQRYEKSLDTNALEPTLLRILELVKESCPDASVVGGIESDGVQLREPLEIVLKTQRVNSILGTELSDEEISDCLKSLDFTVEPTTAESSDSDSGALKVGVPSFRATKDIEVDADLIEEVGRIYGYDKLIPKAPLNEITATSLSPENIQKRKIMDFLVVRGRCLEIYSYPMIGEKLLNQAHWTEKNENLVLANALNPDSDRMRPSIVPSLLEKTAINQKHHQNSRFFELGRSYLSSGENTDDGAFSEEKHQLGIVFYDKNRSPFMDLYNLLLDLTKSIGVPVAFSESGQDQKPDANPLLPDNWVGKHPREYLDISHEGTAIGFINSVHPLMNRNFKIRGHVCMAVLDLTSFMDKPKIDSTRYEPLPRYPGSIFDCTITTDPKTAVADVLAAARNSEISELTDVKVVDVYQPDEDSKSITLRSFFLDREKTLSPDLISEAEGKIIMSLEQAGFPLKKGSGK